MDYSKEIYEYLNGDSATEGYVIPYMSGPDIISFGKSFSKFPFTYSWGTGFPNLSRGDYMKKLIDEVEKQYGLERFFHEFFVRKILRSNTEKKSQINFIRDINKRLMPYGQRINIVDKKMIMEKVSPESVLSDIELNLSKVEAPKSGEVVGEGGMAEIVSTSEPGVLKKRLLNKHLRTTKELSRFDREYRLLKVIGDDVHVLAAIDFDPVEQSYTMRRADGSFDELKNDLTQNEILAFFAQFSSDLKHIQSLKIHHRDIKCANILRIDGRGVISDFGLSKEEGIMGVTTTGVVMGTRGYVDPELIANPDLWKKGYKKEFDNFAFGQSIIANLQLINDPTISKSLNSVAQGLKNHSLGIVEAEKLLKEIYIDN